MRIYTLAKQLTIGWSYDSGGVRTFYDQTFDLNYWPTAAARVSDARLTAGTSMVVAGKRPSIGTTLVERWDFAFSGNPSETTPSIPSKITLYDENTNGKRVVRLLAPVNGVANKAFVQFHDSDSMFVMDCLTGALTLMASPAQVPMLASDALQLISGTRAGTSYIYTYQSDFALEDGGALLMYDNDANGSIDVWVPLADLSQWESFINSSPFDEVYSN